MSKLSAWCWRGTFLHGYRKDTKGPVGHGRGEFLEQLGAGRVPDAVSLVELRVVSNQLPFAEHSRHGGEVRFGLCQLHNQGIHTCNGPHVLAIVPTRQFNQFMSHGLEEMLKSTALGL